MDACNFPAHRYSPAPREESPVEQAVEADRWEDMKTVLAVAAANAALFHSDEVGCRAAVAHLALDSEYWVQDTGKQIRPTVVSGRPEVVPRTRRAVEDRDVCRLSTGAQEVQGDRVARQARAVVRWASAVGWEQLRGSEDEDGPALLAAHK